MRDAVGHFVDMVRHHHERWTVGVGGEIGEGVNQLFTAAEIEPSRRLVEQDDLGIVHQRAGQQDPLLLTGRQRRHRSVGEGADLHAVEAGSGLGAIGVVVAVPPRFEGGVLGGHHHVECHEFLAELARQRGGGVPDPAS